MSTVSTKFQFKLADPTDVFDNEQFLKGNFQIIDQSVYSKTEVDALVTTGSNANGVYVKLPDGTMICSGVVSAVAGTGLKNTSSIGFPANFVGATPSVTATHRSISGKFASCYIYNPTLNSFAIYHIGNDSVDLTGTYFSWVAIGRWK